MLKLLLKAAKEVLYIIVDPQLLSKNYSFVAAFPRLTMQVTIFALRSFEFVFDVSPLAVHQTEGFSNEMKTSRDVSDLLELLIQNEKIKLSKGNINFYIAKTNKCKMQYSKILKDHEN